MMLDVVKHSHGHSTTEKWYIGRGPHIYHGFGGGGGWGPHNYIDLGMGSPKSGSPYLHDTAQQQQNGSGQSPWQARGGGGGREGYTAYSFAF